MVAARATLAADSLSEVLVQWAAPLDIAAQRIEPSGATSYAETSLNTPGVATTPLLRPSIASVTPQTAEALVRFPKLDGADQYQVETSAFSDFRSKTVRGPVQVTRGEGLVSQRR